MSPFASDRERCEATYNAVIDAQVNLEVISFKPNHDAVSRSIAPNALDFGFSFIIGDENVITTFFSDENQLYILERKDVTCMQHLASKTRPIGPSLGFTSI